MMTYVKSVKNTLMNWVNENQTLALVLGGAILLPLGLALVLGVFSLYLFILSFIFGAKVGAILCLTSLMGAAAGGCVAYLIRD